MVVKFHRKCLCRFREEVASWLRKLSGSPHVPHPTVQLRGAQQAWPRSQLASAPRCPDSPKRLQAPGSKLQTSFPQTDCSFHRTTLLFAILLSPHSLLCARVPPLLLSPSPTPFSPPAPPSSTCGKLLEGSVFPPNRGRSLAAAFVFLHSQGGIPRVGCGDATRSGEGGEGSSACFPSTNQAPGNHC